MLTVLSRAICVHHMQERSQPELPPQQGYWVTGNPVANVAGLFSSGSGDPTDPSTDPFTLYGAVRCDQNMLSTHNHAVLCMAACVRAHKPSDCT